MAVGWNGADPVVQADSDDYELGTEYLANSTVVLTHIRVWADATEEGFSGRLGRIWSTAGVQLGQATLPNTLTPGWSSHALDTPVPRTAGQRWIVSYSTGGRYGALTNALLSSVPSADGAVTALSRASSTSGNGIFNATPTLFPTDDVASAPFYGIDVEYTGPTAPSIISVPLLATGLSVTATINATDPDGLSGATYFIDWGDGSTSSGATNSFSHTYATEGLKAVLARVTDSTDLMDHFAAAIVLFAESAFDPTAIIDAVASHAASTGDFDIVNKHEPKSAPGRGLSAHIWAQHLGTARAQSGLAITSALMILNVRIMSNMIAEPQDEIDPEILRAVNRLMTAYSGDFTLGGLIQSIDLLGATGQTLRADAGYVRIGGGEGGMYRVMVITVPMVINDVWPQAA